MHWKNKARVLFRGLCRQGFKQARFRRNLSGVQFALWYNFSFPFLFLCRKNIKKNRIRMEMREILVTLISAQDLKKVNTFGRMTVYGVAWIYPDMKVASTLDTVGNLNPTWNATLKLTADERLVQGGNAVLHIDLYDHTSFGNKYVGSSTIPLSDLRPPVVETQPGTVVEDKESDEAASSSPSPNFMTLPVKILLTSFSPLLSIPIHFSTNYDSTTASPSI